MENINTGITQEEVSEQEKQEQNMVGLKESASSIESIIEAKNEVESEESECSTPAFFIDSEKKFRVEVDVLFNKKTGKIVTVSKTGLGIDFSGFDYLGHTVEWVDFSQPTYEQITNYRQKSLFFNKELGRAIIDPVKLRNFYLVFHMRDWSLRDSNGDKMELEMDDSDSISKNCLSKVIQVFPSFLDVVLSIYEKEILLA